MAIEFTNEMSKAELLEIIAKNNIAINEDATKKEIIAKFNEINEEEKRVLEEIGGEYAEDKIEEIIENEVQGAVENETEKIIENEMQETAESKNYTLQTKPTEDEFPEVKESIKEIKCKKFIYKGPSLKDGSLSAGTVFSGDLDSIKEYLEDILFKFPLIIKMIVPVSDNAKYSIKLEEKDNSFYQIYEEIKKQVMEV